MKHVIWTPVIGEVLPDAPVMYELKGIGIVLDAIVDDDWNTKGTVHYEAHIREDGMTFDFVQDLPKGIAHEHSWNGLVEYSEVETIEQQPAEEKFRKLTWAELII